ncbi:NCS1 family nucleobase:cation symporter-1 [Luteipulveratus mongoliensis]|uniref:NCS1 family nucleobase:cation symporter-1 n=1 Tax=Luteipulveratus mongoliensis TaxID=571913 RepID=UPI0009FB7D1F|nr:NCS1 family nucleobase:cation symporter-1 [Luteipulveratus mongoliensis]
MATEVAVEPAEGGRSQHGQTEHADGRVTLDDRSALAHSPYSNEDLDPVELPDRHWNTYNYAALWVGMSHNIPSWLLASGLIAAGMSWQQAVVIILLANVIVLIPILLNGHGGTKYGIPFPVLARSSFGVLGANLPALVRAFAATCWFGVQTWIGGEGIFLLAGKMFGDSWANASHIGDFAWTQWLSFFVFWLIEIAIIVRGIETLRRFENWAAPVVMVAALALLAYVYVQADGFGNILSQSGSLKGDEFWRAFGPALMGMIAFWATLSLNISDFTRFGGSQKKQMLGQTYGLPTTMTAFAVMSVLVTSASEEMYGKAIWDPIQLAARIDSWVGTLLALATVMIATLSVNIAANLVSPSYDFANAAPKYVNFRKGALITCVLSVLIFPWKLVSDPNIYIFTWLGVVGAILGPVAGILAADYWVVRRRHIVVRDLYRREGLYWYSGGWNWRAVVAFGVAAILSAGGSYSKDGKGPFPEDGMIPFLKPLADYGWLVGLVSGAVIYVALMKAGKVPVAYDSSGSPDDAPLDEKEVTA